MDFVIGRFSHFNITIAYSNSTFGGARVHLKFKQDEHTPELTLEQKSCSSSLNFGDRGLFNAGVNVELDSNARLGTVMVMLLALTTLTLFNLPSETEYISLKAVNIRCRSRIQVMDESWRCFHKRLNSL